jgi:hypothetical protein
MADIDQETKAIGEIASIVSGLEDEQRGRVIRYILERFQIDGGKPATKKTTVGGQIEPVQNGDTQFDDIASLYDACNPNTDALRALVAGYWLQVCQGAQSFDGQSANKELKHLGHVVGNITAALTTLISQKPALVLQLRKSGSTRQARKSYKVSEAGIRKIKAMVAGSGDSE